MFIQPFWGSEVQADLVHELNSEENENFFLAWKIAGISRKVCVCGGGKAFSRLLKFVKDVQHIPRLSVDSA